MQQALLSTEIDVNVRALKISYQWPEYVPTGLPDFAAEELEEDEADVDAEEFLSRNFLVMFTVLNFFG